MSRIALGSRLARPAHRALVCLMVLSTLSTACVPGSPAAPANGAPAAQLPSGSYYLRAMDGKTLPVSIGNGARIESGFVTADATNGAIVGWGESVGRGAAASMQLATGTARVLGADDADARIAAITWESSPADVRADSVRWSADSVIVYRTGTAPSAAGAGHRLVYTRATAADTL